MKKSLLILVALLAVSALLAASAYTSAVVESKADFTVVNTDEALLALSPGDHNASYLYPDSGNSSKRLYIDWDKGVDNKDFGVQRDSTYIWDDLFQVTNNSEKNIKVYIGLDPNDNLGLNVFFGRVDDNDDWVIVGSRWSTDGTLSFELKPGESKWVDTKLATHRAEGANLGNGTRNLTMIVEAEAVQSTPQE